MASKKQRNPVKEQLDEQRRWGMVHKDRKKYTREPPNHHELDDEIQQALDEMTSIAQENGEYD